jgi:phage-related protein
MEDAYYFSQGRLVPNNTYLKFVDANNARYIKNGNNDNDIETGSNNENTGDTKNTRNSWNAWNVYEKWYNLSLFRPRKFQIFSQSILRYK